MLTKLLVRNFVLPLLTCERQLMQLLTGNSKRAMAFYGKADITAQIDEGEGVQVCHR